MTISIRELVRLLQPTKPRTVEEWMERHNKRPAEYNKDWWWTCKELILNNGFVGTRPNLEIQTQCQLPEKIYSVMVDGAYSGMASYLMVDGAYSGMTSYLTRDVAVMKLEVVLIKLGEIECP